MSIVYTPGLIPNSALDYANRGFAIIPTHAIIGEYCTCGQRIDAGKCKAGKHPCTAHGYQDATTDAEAIRVWWRDKPWANVAIPTHGNKYFVLECDPRNGGDETIATFVAEHGAMPMTPTVRSGGGGTHWYFRYPPGRVIKSRAGVAPGVDVRGDAGYVLAPPSTHLSGNRYEWVTGLDTPLADAPGWVLGLVCDAPAAPRPAGASGSITPPKTPPKGMFVFAEEPDFRSHPGADEGKRNDAIMRLIGVHTARGDSPKTIEALALSWAQRCTPPIPDADVYIRLRWAQAKRDDANELTNSGDADGSLFANSQSSQARNASNAAGGAGSETPSQLSTPHGNDEVFVNSTRLREIVDESAKTRTTLNVNVNANEYGTEYVHDTRSNEYDNGIAFVFVNESADDNEYVPVNANDSAIVGVDAFVSEIRATETVDGDRVTETVDGTRTRGTEYSTQTKAQAEIDEVESSTPGASPPASGDEDAANNANELTNSPPADDWPRLGAEAYHGIVGEIVRAIAPETEADPAGVMLTLLTAIGNAVGRAPRFAMNAGTHHATLFAALVGDTASGKGQAWTIVQTLMRRADPEWEDGAIAYGLSSGEGLVDRLKDPEPDPDADTAFAFPDERKLLCVETEFAKVIGAMRRENNTLSPVLRSAWDSQTLEVLTRGKSKLRASNAHVGVVAHVTPQELDKLLSGSVEVANGFANRFLWASVRRSRSLPEGGDVGVVDAFAEPLAKAINRAKAIGRVERDAEAKALWASVYDGLTAARPGAFGMSTSRAHAQTLRLSLMYAMLDGSAVITPSHLRAALAVWAYCEASAARIFGGADANADAVPVPQPLWLRVLDIIVKSPGITRKGLHAATNNHIKSDDMDAALATLATQGSPTSGWYSPTAAAVRLSTGIPAPKTRPAMATPTNDMKTRWGISPPRRAGSPSSPKTLRTLRTREQTPRPTPRRSLFANSQANKPANKLPTPPARELIRKFASSQRRTRRFSTPTRS